ncbi:MAG: nucleotidyltransferase domain-containing protein [Saprospiraceae bacterium]
MTTQDSLSAEILKKIKEYARSVDPDAEVILFGSRARGDAHADSDWDILILISSAVTLTAEQAFRHKLFEIELEYGIAISTFVYSKTDWNGKFRATPLYDSITKEGTAI